MKNKSQNKFRQHYQKLAADKNLTVRAGRSEAQEKIEINIWEDIRNKLHFRKNISILDIGCGCGTIVNKMMSFSKINHNPLYLMDDKTILEKLDHVPNNTHLLKGYLFEEFDENNLKYKFDMILAYSVLHYIDNPFRFILSLSSFLKPNGEMLVGDIPNHSKRGRMLTSIKGSNFQRNYRGKPAKNHPLFKSQLDYFKNLKPDDAMYLDDHFMIFIISKLRYLGFEVYWLPQPDTLPFCKTREDLLIKKVSY